MALKDVNVIINLATPAPLAGLGKPLILTEKVGTSSFKEYFSLDALAVDYAEGTETYAKAKTLYSQAGHAQSVAVATYQTGAPDSALLQYADREWHFALLTGGIAADQLKVAQFIDGQDFKFFAALVKDNAGREALKTFKRTIVLDHPAAGEHLDAAVVGSLASLPVGSITWKFKGGFAGITPRYLAEGELAEIEQDNAIAYVKKAGKGQLSNGITGSGEYIDALHGKDFVKVTMENEIQTALQNADKVPYDNRGIGLIEGAATTALQRAFTQGIIGVTADNLPDYTITALSRNEVNESDRANRIYKGLSFRFGNAGAIHEVEVYGQIEL
ncbi:DUF3383 family protein [Exiguobacterium sp. R-39]|uniref:DUF3383 family protein n=1 Tax=Exiguobacterium sp. R-39 TaxID=3416708 RepID=UPI003CF6EAE5